MLLIRVYLFMDSAIAEEDSGTKSRQRGLADHLSSDAPARVQDKRLQMERRDRVDWIDTATQAFHEINVPTYLFDLAAKVPPGAASLVQEAYG
ncbi:hypothetical protein AK812_SmicGene5247 [Symbiodinium microadriaticum]|uniref:Uncharacterized protein n=1 Tax=Symbiodinium microadriaticum TaxID=2951 RepID=A0A1Q9EUC3_SYMMI|nr:hypothetical protein AK812_SmicGene5247 [Symbiodinium microadriaticum]